MDTQTYIYWQDEEVNVGYLQAYPDYWTQGESVETLEENLRDIYAGLTSGAIPCARKAAQLQIA